MVQFSNLKFSTSLGVLYGLKVKHNHEKLSDTYNLLSESDVDTIVDVLNVSYNVANNTTLNESEFYELLSNNDMGFLVLSDIFAQVVNGIMFSGLSPEEVQARKNQLGLKK